MSAGRHGDDQEEASTFHDTGRRGSLNQGNQFIVIHSLRSAVQRVFLELLDKYDNALQARTEVNQTFSKPT